MKMIIDCISDLHGHRPFLAEGGDLLLIGGDLVRTGAWAYEYAQFLEWVKTLAYRKIVIIAGNHDGLLAKGRWRVHDYFDETPHICYLEDSGTEFEYYGPSCKMTRDIVKKKLKIWGTPWTPPFCGWDFMLPVAERKAKFDLIPSDTNILVSHGPPIGVLDLCEDMDGNLEHAGCAVLRTAVEKLPDLQLHVFGHIHEGYGQTLVKRAIGTTTVCVNASMMTRDYKAENKPIRIIL